MLTVYYRNESGLVLRPTPLVTINQTANRNQVSSLGSTYSITLTGAIIAAEGSPVYSGATGKPSVLNNMKSIGTNWDGNSIARPDGTTVPYGEKLGSIINKQTVIRELFAMDGQKMELSSISNDEAKLVFYPVVESITFDEGAWVDICRYTVNLVASSLLKEDGTIVEDSQPYLVSSLEEMHNALPDGQNTEKFSNAGAKKETDIINQFGGFVSEFSDTWSLEPDESLATSDNNGNIIPMGYRLTRSMSATGMTKYIADFSAGDTAKPKKYDAWQMAKGFVQTSILKESGGAGGAEDYPAYKNSSLGVYASGMLDLENYSGFNNSRTESIDIAAGTYAVEDSWTIASGNIPAYEQFDISVSTDTGAAFVGVTINGTIRGASNLSSADRTKPEPVGNSRYDRASDKYYQLTNNGQFGVSSTLYKRANGCCEQVLNSQPSNISVSLNEYSGEISYSASFDNRPINIFTGVMSESISVNDTMPGDVYASIPVLGRTTGPVLQYMDMRTEYKRSLSIQIQLDYTNIGYGSNRSNLLMTKPTLRLPLKNEIDQVIREISPANEPGVRKYFIDAPTESWNPRTGSYSLNLNWTYELDN